MSSERQSISSAVIGSPAGGGELVHDAARYADPLVLRLLGQPRHRRRIPSQRRGCGESPGGGQLERGGGGQPGSAWHVAEITPSQPCRRVPGRLERPGDGLEVLPPPRPALLEGAEVELDLLQEVE